MERVRTEYDKVEARFTCKRDRRKGSISAEAGSTKRRRLRRVGGFAHEQHAHSDQRPESGIARRLRFGAI